MLVCQTTEPFIVRTYSADGTLVFALGTSVECILAPRMLREFLK